MINVPAQEIIKLVGFLADHGVSNPDNYRFEVDPKLKGLNLKVNLNVTHLPSGNKIIVVLDP
ncbi:MAG: hypothetical protein HY785_08905 [Oscillatoriophycideae cyanobacterium NC_groundwater_1537_Pr4_S-0.65um_50_18]|nr:hypothetical protein [Oscillatoriophycideae cyanobacterium NC_groundwater_1537_Pr4_S-0.65um_50_18]